MAERQKARAVLREFALAFPGAHEDFPWGESVIKVAKKVFVFLGREGDAGVGMSVKLPVSGADLLELPFAQPTGYGLGKSGWVTIQFAPGEAAPMDLLRQWIEESYRAVAPKRLARDGAASGPKPPAAQRGDAEAQPAKSRAAAKKSAAKKRS
jgi:predicted DNA-binding protein (MmcQ/YjbR family)